MIADSSSLPTKDHTLAVCDQVTSESNFCINSEVSEITFNALNLLAADQPKVEEKIVQLKNFFTKHGETVSKNDLITLMSQDLDSKPPDLPMVSKCFHNLGKKLLELEDVQQYMDGFTHALVKRLLSQVCRGLSCFFCFCWRWKKVGKS